MPLTSKGEKIRANMTREYGKEGERVFYASRNAGKISGVDMLKKAIAAGEREAESQKQAERLLAGEYVSGRDRAKLKSRR